MDKDVQSAVTQYDKLLRKYRPELKTIHEEFVTKGQSRKLSFGGRPVFRSLRPNFLSIDQYNEIQLICLHLRNAITKFKQAAMMEPEMMAQSGILEAERALVEINPGFDRLSISARWDSFMQSDGSVKFVELNAESPAGIAYSDVSADLYRELPFVQDFMRHYGVLHWNIRKTLLNELLATYAVYKGNKRRAKPNIAIIDWNDVPTYTEFELFKEFFEAEGYRCIIADPRDLTYAERCLRSGDFEIDLVYKRILTNDCVQRPVETKALVDAARDLRVCLINPFRAKMVHKKSIFAVLTHERNRHLFSHSERSVIKKHIPWTRMIAKENTIFKGKRIDLVDFVAAKKDAFVIKPNDEYGGKGVTLGRETSETVWRKTIQEALDGEPSVVQEIVELPRVPFPFFDHGDLYYQDMVVDLDPYVFGHRVDGVLTRLSSSSLANVTAGGGTTPTFVIHRFGSAKSSSAGRPGHSKGRRTRKPSVTGSAKRKVRSSDQTRSQTKKASGSAMSAKKRKRSSRR